MSSKAISWKRRFLDHVPPRQATVQDFASVADLTEDLTNDNAITTWQRLAQEKDVLFLSVNHNGHIQLFHNVGVIGNRFMEHLISSAFCSFGTSAPPIEIPVASDLEEVNRRVPSWDLFLSSLDSIEEFKALTLESQDDEDQRVGDLIDAGLVAEDANATRAFVLTHLNICAIPPCIAKSFLDSPSKEPAELAVRLWKDMSDTDAENDGEVENYLKLTEYLDYVIKFLWLAQNRHLKPINYILSEHPEVLNWASAVHDAFIRPLSQDPNQNSVTSPATENALGKVAFSISSLQEHLSSSKDKSESEGKGFTKRYVQQTQNMILNASATSPFEEAEKEPTEDLARFLKLPTVSSARNWFKSHIRANKYLTFIPTNAQVMSIYYGSFLWDDKITPVNFSILHHGKNSADDAGLSSKDAQALLLKESIGNGISDTDVTLLLKQDRNFAKDAAELIDQFTNFLATCIFVFGELSYISIQIKSWITHITRNKSVYDSLQAQDQTFFAQVLYFVDAAIQTHLESCMIEEERSDVDDKCIDFKSTQVAVLRRQFSCSLPPSLCTKKKETKPILDVSSDDESKKRERKRKLKIKQKEDDVKKVKNSSPNRQWLLKDEESFAKVFHKNIKSCPKQGDKFLCLRFWIKGECFKNCKFIHSDISAESKPKLGEWIEACRQNKDRPDF